MSCSATTSANSFAGGGVGTAGVGTAGVGEVGGGSGARETDGCGETTGAAGSVTAAPVGAGACACTSWGRFAQPTRIKARMRRANPARRDFPHIMVASPFGSTAFSVALACTCHKVARSDFRLRSEEHTSELQSQSNLVCRLLLEKKKKYTDNVSMCDV